MDFRVRDERLTDRGQVYKQTGVDGLPEDDQCFVDRRHLCKQTAVVWSV